MWIILKIDNRLKCNISWEIFWYFDFCIIREGVEVGWRPAMVPRTGWCSYRSNIGLPLADYYDEEKHEEEEQVEEEEEQDYDDQA